MKTLLEKFTDQEFKELKKKKSKYDLNWHDFILLLTNIEDSE